ncbi:MAG: hypothetical protein HQ472_05680 [Ignavibacteria bacterium]|nr:hypothetical protein [Ignavibacteria bacterium]
MGVIAPFCRCGDCETETAPVVRFTTGAALDTVPEDFVDFAVTFDLNADFNEALLTNAELLFCADAFLTEVLEAPDEVLVEVFPGLETELE